jgi:hypothetical protein
MPKPRISDYQLLTSTMVAMQFGISLFQLKYWIKIGVLPAPTQTRKNEQGQVMAYLFDEKWVETNRHIVDRIKTTKGGTQKKSEKAS